MVISYEAAAAVRLRQDWQKRYQDRAREVLGSWRPVERFTVCIVGRAGVGKGSLVNHLLGENVAQVSHNVAGNDHLERGYNVGNLRLLDVPGYDGKHTIASHFKKESGKEEGRLSMENFVKGYRIFEKETRALIIVVYSRITPRDKQLMAMAIESRKFFCIVRTNADHIAGVSDETQKMELSAEMEHEIRNGLDLTKNLNIRIFKVSIPWPDSIISDSPLKGGDKETIMNNAKLLDFPNLAAYLNEPRGLYEEIMLHSFVKKELKVALEPYTNVKKRKILLTFSGQAVLGTLLPIVGPVVLTFLMTMVNVIRALGAVGLVQEPVKAIDKLVEQGKRNKVIVATSSKEALVSFFEDSLIHIFGKVIVEIAVYDLALAAAEESVGSVFPIVGAFVSAAHMPSRYRKLGGRLLEKTCMLHELWIMQNVKTLLLHLD